MITALIVVVVFIALCWGVWLLMGLLSIPFLIRGRSNRKQVDEMARRMGYAGFNDAALTLGLAQGRMRNHPPAHAGDTWTFTALDTDSKLILSYLVGERDGQTALAFMDDLRSRLEDRPQISSDGLKAYREAVDGAFGGAVDFAQVIKSDGKDADADDRKYSSATSTGIEKIAVWGPQYADRQHVARRAAQLVDPHGSAPFDPLDQRFLKEAGKALRHDDPLLCFV